MTFTGRPKLTVDDINHKVATKHGNRVNCLRYHNRKQPALWHCSVCDARWYQAAASVIDGHAVLCRCDTSKRKRTFISEEQFRALPPAIEYKPEPLPLSDRERDAQKRKRIANEVAAVRSEMATFELNLSEHDFEIDLDVDGSSRIVETDRITIRVSEPSPTISVAAIKTKDRRYAGLRSFNSLAELWTWLMEVNDL